MHTRLCGRRVRYGTTTRRLEKDTDDIVGSVCHLRSVGARPDVHAARSEPGTSRWDQGVDERPWVTGSGGPPGRSRATQRSALAMRRTDTGCSIEAADAPKRTLSFDECFVENKDLSVGAGGTVVTSYVFSATRVREE